MDIIQWTLLGLIGAVVAALALSRRKTRPSEKDVDQRIAEARTAAHEKGRRKGVAQGKTIGLAEGKELGAEERDRLSAEIEDLQTQLVSAQSKNDVELFWPWEYQAAGRHALCSALARALHEKEHFANEAEQFDQWAEDVAGDATPEPPEMPSDARAWEAGAREALWVGKRLRPEPSWKALLDELWRRLRSGELYKLSRRRPPGRSGGSGYAPRSGKSPKP